MLEQTVQMHLLLRGKRAGRSPSAEHIRRTLKCSVDEGRGGVQFTEFVFRYPVVKLFPVAASNRSEKTVGQLAALIVLSVLFTGEGN